MVSNKGPDHDQAADIASFLHHRDDAPDEDFASPTPAPVTRAEAQEMERSMLARIATIEHDHRLGAAALQQTLQNQYADLRRRLRRQRSLLLTVLTIGITLFAAALIWMYGQLQVLHQTSTAETGALRGEIEGLSGIASQTQRANVQVEGLGKRIATLDARLQQTATELTRYRDSAGQETEARLRDIGRRIQALADGQGRLAQNLAAVQAAPADRSSGESPASAPESADPLEAGGAPTTRPPPPPEQGSTRDAANAASAEAEAAEDADTSSDGSTSPSTEAGPPQGAGPGVKLGAEAGEARPDRAAGGVPGIGTSGDDVVVGDHPFALQLIGAYDQSSLLDFAREHPFTTPLYIGDEVYRGRTWFVLIHSLYPSRAAAERALTEPPPELAGLDVWIRDLAPETRLRRMPPPAAGD